MKKYSLYVKVCGIVCEFLCDVWVVKETAAHHSSFFLLSLMSGDGWGVLFCYYSVSGCDCVAHTPQIHSGMINSRHLLLSFIDLAKSVPHWLRSPADYNQKDAQSEAFFNPKDTKDRCWAVKLLHLHLSRCHPARLVFHSTSSADTSRFISGF